MYHILFQKYFKELSDYQKEYSKHEKQSCSSLRFSKDVQTILKGISFTNENLFENLSKSIDILYLPFFKRIIQKEETSIKFN